MKIKVFTCGFVIISFFGLLSCSSNTITDDEDVISTILPVPSPKSIMVFDYGNVNSSKDIFVNFEITHDESKILEYRLVIIKADSSTPTIEEFSNLDASRYFRISKAGSAINLLSDTAFNDYHGEKISNDIDYKAYVLSVSNTVLRSNNVSSHQALTLKNEPYYEVKTLGMHPNKIEALSLNENTNELYSPSFSNETLYKMDIATGVSSLVESFSVQNGPLGGNFNNTSTNYYLSFWYLNSIYKFDKNDNKILYASGIPTPTGIAFDNNDNMYVSSYTTSTIYKVDKNGKAVSFATSPHFSTLDGLVFVEDNLFSVNATDAKVSKTSMSGKVELFATLPTNPISGQSFTGYITYKNGNFYVPSVNSIYKIDINGNVEKIAGNVDGYIDGPSRISRFSEPNGIKASITGDTIFIGDQTKIRMLIRHD